MINKLKEFGIRFEENVHLIKYSTIRCDAIGKLIVFPENISELKKVISYCREYDKKYFVIGNGSNLIFLDNNYVLIKLCGFNQIEKKGNILTCGSGALLNDVCFFAQENGLSGMEGLVGIPAQIGGATTMNARAFGYEMKDIILSVKCLTSNGKIVVFNTDQCDFAYKQSIFQYSKFVILSVKLKLINRNKEEITQTIESIREKRYQKQPKGFSAGCVFRNSKSSVAGKLIEKCGLSGKKHKNFQINKQHCNFIINNGKGKGKDLLKLIGKIKKKVYNKTNQVLEEEVIFVEDK